MSSLKQNTEERIREWTRDLASTESVAPDRLQELESHLVDSVLSFREKGLTEEEAFVVASSRIGSKDTLASEFSKSGDVYLWANRVYWMCLGYLGIMLAMRMVGAFAAVGQLALTAAVDDPLKLFIARCLMSLLGLLVVGAGLLKLAKGTGLRVRFTPRRLLITVVTIVLVSGAMTIAAQVASATLLRPEQLGLMAQRATVVNLFSSLLIPLCFAIFALRLRAARIGDQSDLAT